MYRNGKLFLASEAFFVSFPLIIFYVTTITLLSDVEGAQALSSPRDITEARKTIGHFLGTEAGEAWLAQQAKSNSAPLTTADLMKAILGATKEGDEVWRAAATLIEALKSQSPVGTRLNSTTEQNDTWKDLIGDIEMENDIICLYRKSANETSKRSDDWKQFLRTVSPSYVVHLAIDTGRKYVICLKKIEVPEIKDQEKAGTISSSTIATTEASAKSLPSGATTLSSTVMKTTSTSSSPILKEKLLKDDTSPQQRGNDRCKDNGGNVPNDAHTKGRENSTINLSNMVGLKTSRREMDNDPSAGTQQRKVDNGKYIDEGYSSSRRNDRSRSYARENIPPAARDECKRPIIFFVPHRYDLGTYQRVSPMQLPIYENAGTNVQWTMQNSRFPLGVMPPKNFVSTLTPSNAMTSLDLRSSTFGYNNVYQSVGYQPPILKNIQPKISRRRLEPLPRPTTRLIEPRKRVPLSIQNAQFSGTNNAQGRLGNYLLNPNYIGTNPHQPRFKEFPTGRTKTPMGWIGMDSSLFIRRPSGFDQRRIQPGNVANTRPGNIANMKPGNQETSKKMIYDPLQRFSQSKIGYGDRYFRNPAIYRDMIIGPHAALPSQSLVNSRPQPDIYYKPRPGRYPIPNWKPPPSRHNFIDVDPRIVSFPRPRQTVQCFLHRIKNYQTRYDSDMPYWMDSRILSNCNVDPRTCPCQNPSSNNIPERANCPKCYDKPIKLEIFIHGKMQNDVGVQTEAGQKSEIVGSADSVMSDGSTALRGTSPGVYELHDDNVKDASDVDSEVPFVQDDKISFVENEPHERHSFEIEKNDSAQNKTEIATVGSNVVSAEVSNVEQRLFHETTTIRSNSTVTANTTNTTNTKNTSTTSTTSTSM